LIIIVLFIVVLGLYPRPFFELTQETVDAILSKMNYKQ